MMKDRCIQAVSQAIGRDITQAEAQGIEDRIVKNMRFVAAKDPEGFRSLSSADRLKAAAQLAAREIQQDAELKKRRIVLAIQAHDKLETFINEAKQTGMDGLEALKRTLVFAADGKNNTLSAESVGKAIRADAIRQLIDTFEAVDPRFWGLFESKEGVETLTRAIFGEHTGVPEADKGAKAWLDVAARMRDRFNEAGGKIGLLENWSLPQHHSQLKVNKAGADAWINDTIGKLDRRKYVNDDGTQMNDQQLQEVLRNAWLTIATGGINQATPGAQGQSMLANRRAAHRELHFKDAQGYLDYQAKYGEKSLWGVITGHVEGLSREIAMLETFGPNPDQTFQLLLEKQLQSSAVLDPTKTAKLQENARSLSSLYDFVTGKTQPIVNEHLAQGFDTLRNWLVASRLGSAVITALTDEATLHLTAKVNNLPEMQLIQNELSALNIANRTEENLAHRAGLGLETMLSHLNRWGTDNLGPTFSSKMANTVMRASGLEALDGARKRAFGVTMMSALGEVVQKYDKLADLDPTDHKILLSKGITDTDFAIWKQAELEKWGAGNGVLTPESIMRLPVKAIYEAIKPRLAELQAEKEAKIAAIEKMATMTPEAKQQAIQSWTDTYNEQIANLDEKARRDAVTRLLGTVLEETDMAVIQPGATDKSITGEGMQRGTWKGELTRSFFQFKAFPLAMISRHWMRGMNMDTAGGKAAYIGSLVVGTTILGAISQSINDLLSGKDVRNYNPFQGEHGAKNWINAFLKGGSLGIYGDFLFSGATQTSQTGPLAALMGPTAGLVEETFKLTQGNIVQAMKGEKTNFGAEAVRFVKGNTPGANLWYMKAALDHIIFHQLQEYFTPGYLSQMQRRAQKEFGQSYWWQPGTGVEGMQAPNLAKAVGE
jgi:vacuolar-type H+-ATPase subunit E/Vma4